MPAKLITVAFAASSITLLGSCSDKPADDVKAFLHSDGVKQVAAWGTQAVLTLFMPGDAPIEPAQDRQTQPHGPLVSAKDAVGHRDFAQAKKVLPRVYAGMEEEFYCGCQYSGKTIDWSSCGFEPRKNAERARRLEWEHVITTGSIMLYYAMCMITNTLLSCIGFRVFRGKNDHFLTVRYGAQAVVFGRQRGHFRRHVLV